MGSITGYRVDYNGAGVRRGQRHIPSKNWPKYPNPPGGYNGIKDVRANCFCASLLRTQSTSRCHPRHASSVRAVEEMWRYIALYVSGHFKLISMHGFNCLKCSVNPIFSFDRSLSLSIIYILWKIKENLYCGRLIFFNFSALASSNVAIIVAARSS